MRSPGPVLLWYSVLAVRVPHVREVVRACSRWLLMHSEPLWTAAVLSAAALGWMVASRPERAVGAVLCGPTGADAVRRQRDPVAAGPGPQADAEPSGCLGLP